LFYFLLFDVGLAGSYKAFVDLLFYFFIYLLSDILGIEPTETLVLILVLLAFYFSHNNFLRYIFST
jgi:hypothetical protein